MSTLSSPCGSEFRMKKMHAEVDSLWSFYEDRRIHKINVFRKTADTYEVFQIGEIAQHNVTGRGSGRSRGYKRVARCSESRSPLARIGQFFTSCGCRSSSKICIRKGRSIFMRTTKSYARCYFGDRSACSARTVPILKCGSSPVNCIFQGR